MTDLRDLRQLEAHFFRAPSAHNTQPWLLEYSREAVELRFDAARELPAGDPTRRDLFLSLGALIEAVLIVGAEAEIAVRFAADVDDSRRSLGSFVPADVPYETQFTAADLERRQTSRLAYVPQRLTAEDLAAARQHAGTGRELHELAARDIKDLAVAGDRHLYGSPDIVAELRDWLRLSRRDPRYEQDGLSYECLDLSRAQAATVALLLHPRVYPAVRVLRLQRAFAAAGASLLRKEGSVLVLTGAAGTPAEMLEHGRALLRVWLALARLGLYTHPLSQILDSPDTERVLANRIGAFAPTRPLSIFRAGRSGQPARSARRR